MNHKVKAISKPVLFGLLFTSLLVLSSVGYISHNKIVAVLALPSSNSVTLDNIGVTFTVQYSFYAAHHPITLPADGDGQRAPIGKQYMYLSYSAVNNGPDSTMFGFSEIGNYSLTITFSDGSTLSPDLGVGVQPPGIPLRAGTTRLISENQRVTSIAILSRSLGRDIVKIVLDTANKIVLIQPAWASVLRLDDPMTSNPNNNWQRDFWGNPVPPGPEIGTWGTRFKSGGGYVQNPNTRTWSNGGVWETRNYYRMNAATDEFRVNFKVTKTYTGAYQEMVAFMSSERPATGTDSEFGWTLRGNEYSNFIYFYKQQPFDWREAYVYNIAITHEYKIINRDRTWLDAYVDQQYKNSLLLPNSQGTGGNVNYYVTVGWNSGSYADGSPRPPIPTDSSITVSRVQIYAE